MFPSSFSYVGFPVLDMSLSGASEAAHAQDADGVEALESSIEKNEAGTASSGAKSWLFERDIQDRGQR